MNKKETLATELGLDVDQLDDLILTLARSGKRREGPTTYSDLQQAVQQSYGTNRLVGDDLTAHNPDDFEVREDGQGNITRKPIYAVDPVFVFPGEEPKPEPAPAAA